jgi:hypothetical protein
MNVDINPFADTRQPFDIQYFLNSCIIFNI